MTWPFPPLGRGGSRRKYWTASSGRRRVRRARGSGASAADRKFFHIELVCAGWFGWAEFRRCVSRESGAARAYTPAPTPSFSAQTLDASRLSFLHSRGDTAQPTHITPLYLLLWHGLVSCTRHVTSNEMTPFRRAARFSTHSLLPCTDCTQWKKQSFRAAAVAGQPCDYSQSHCC